MRVGNNPNRGKGAEKLQPIILSVVTHLPNMEGYHEKRLQVIQTCLTTMREHSLGIASILVWDNGSCDALRDWLRDEYKPDLLMLSPNIGKTAARTSIIRMCPPDSIVGYSDDDMYFYPDWLALQLQLLRIYPNVAAVSGYPVRTAFRWGTMNTIAWAGTNAKLEIGRFIPREWEEDFCRSVGRDVDWHCDTWTKDDKDYRVTYQGKQAYCTAHHCQFIGYQKTLAQVAKYDNEAMGDEKCLDIALDNIGLRLCTTQRLTRHMGNIMEADYGT